MKKRIKKLELNRETVRDLAQRHLPEVQGAASRFICTEISRCYQCMTDEESYCICP
jgi:hypothetical protein